MYFLLLVSEILMIVSNSLRKSISANPAGVALGTIVPSILFGHNKTIDSNSWMFFTFVSTQFNYH